MTDFFFFLLHFFQILDEGQFSKQNQWQNRTITEWTSQQVARWLMGLNLEHHIPEFTAKNIDGEQLLRLDSSELKVGTTLMFVYIGYIAPTPFSYVLFKLV